MRCSRCAEPAVIKQGNQSLCDKHYRFGQMRASAKRNGKVSPSNDEMECMIDKEMHCPECSIKMNWRSRDGKSSVASLQHYRSGAIGIICLSCNSRHASMDGDSYCSISKDNKRCPSCFFVKPRADFFVDNGRSGVLKRKSICKKCSDEKINQWREENKDAYNEYQRQYRKRRADSGNPITR